jgi:hypothetical protein
MLCKVVDGAYALGDILTIDEPGYMRKSSNDYDVEQYSKTQDYNYQVTHPMIK